jgi:hypothetical protein
VRQSLRQRRQQDARQTDRQAQEPERVDQNGRIGRGKLGGIDEGRGREERSRFLVVGEQLVGFREVECPLVERVQLEATDGCTNECRDSGREQGGLRFSPSVMPARGAVQ